MSGPHEQERPNELEPDRLVAQALGSLPVPQHRPGFWEGVDAAFDEIDQTEIATAMPTTQTPSPDPGTADLHDLDAARQSPRRRANLGRRYQMLSAAAAVAVIIAGVGVLNSNSGNGRKNEPISGASLGDPEVDAQFETVAAFFQAGEDRDLDRLWSLLGPLSKKQLAAKDKLQPMLDSRPEADRDQAVFAPRSAWRSYSVDGDPHGAVVAAVRTDGADALVLPVVRVDGQWLVEYGLTGSIKAMPELVSRSARQPGEPIDIPIEVSSDDRGDIYGRVDGRGDFVKLEKAGNGLFRFDQKLSDLPAGDHYLETVMRGPDWFFISSVNLTGPPTTAPTTVGGNRVAQPIEVALNWSRSIAAGDADEAWRLMGPDSQAYLQAQGGWRGMVTEMAEGSHAAWSRSAEAGWGFEPMPDDPQAGVVTVAGTLELEGKSEYRLGAYPFVNVDGTWKIEPFAFGPGDTDAEWVTPAAGPNGLGGIEPGATVEVLAPGKVHIRLDLGALEAMTMDKEDNPAGPNERWTYKPAKPFTNGTHSVVVVTRGDRFFTASPGEFAVEG